MPINMAPGWRRDVAPRGVRCLVTVRTSQGPRVYVASASADYGDEYWFCDGHRVHNVIAWLPAPMPAPDVPATYDPIIDAIPYTTTWTLPEALELCRAIEAICPTFGCHVALTGGLLYKEGPRKDLDLVFYRIRQIEEIDVDRLFIALVKIGVKTDIEIGEDEPQRWRYRATFQGKAIDCFFPEAIGGEYNQPVAVPDDIFA